MPTLLRRSIITLVAAYLLLCGGLYHSQEWLLFMAEPLPADYRYNFKVPHEDVIIKTRDARLHAAYFNVERPRGVVLFLHGRGRNLRDWGFLPPMLVRRGHAVLALDYRGFGLSTGQLRSEAGLHADAAAAYDYLLERFPEDQIVIYGSSLGSAPALHLAARHNPRMVVLEAPPYSVEELVRERLPIVPGFLLKYPMRNFAWADDVSSPIVIIHGTADTVVPYAAGRRLAARAGEQGTLVTVKGGGHYDLSAFPEYHQALGMAFGRTRP